MTGGRARWDIFTGIFDKVIISVLSKGDRCIQAPLCMSVKLNWEWRFHFPSSWPRPLVFFRPGHQLSPSCPSLFFFFPAKDRPAILDCLCDAVAERRCVQVRFKPNRSKPHAAESGRTGMSEPRRVDCPSRHLSGNGSNDEKESGKLLKKSFGLYKLESVHMSCPSSSFFSGHQCELIFKLILLVFKELNGPHPTYSSARVLWTPQVFF